MGLWPETNYFLSDKVIGRLGQKKKVIKSNIPGDGGEGDGFGSEQFDWHIIGFMGLEGIAQTFAT